jgi:hypothetical protein
METTEAAVLFGSRLTSTRASIRTSSLRRTAAFRESVPMTTKLTRLSSGDGRSVGSSALNTSGTRVMLLLSRWTLM